MQMPFAKHLEITSLAHGGCGPSKRSADGKELQYMTYTLTDVMVTSVSNSGDPHMEEFSLNYTKIEFDYKPQKADGTLDASVKSGWDIKANKAA